MPEKGVGVVKVSRKRFEKVATTWVVFGEGKDGTVDIMTDPDDSFDERGTQLTGLPPDLADRLCELHAAFYDKAFKLIEAAGLMGR